MAERRRHEGDRHAGTEQSGGERVAQVVQPQRLRAIHAGLIRRTTQSSHQPLTGQRQPSRSAQRHRVTPPRQRRDRVASLRIPHRSQNPHNRPWKLHSPPAALRLGEILQTQTLQHGGDRRSEQFQDYRGNLEIPLNPKVLNDFRQMAAHSEVVEQVIEESSNDDPPSRAKVLRAIKAVKEAVEEAAGDRARAERARIDQEHAKEVGWTDEKQAAFEEAIATLPASWEPTGEIGGHVIGLITAIDRFIASGVTVDDVIYCWEAHYGELKMPWFTDNQRADLKRCLEHLKPYYVLVEDHEDD